MILNASSGSKSLPSPSVPHASFPLPHGRITAFHNFNFSKDAWTEGCKNICVFIAGAIKSGFLKLFARQQAPNKSSARPEASLFIVFALAG